MNLKLSNNNDDRAMKKCVILLGEMIGRPSWHRCGRDIHRRNLLVCNGGEIDRYISMNSAFAISYNSITFPLLGSRMERMWLCLSETYILSINIDDLW